MSHDDFEFEPAPGLPAPLPPGERLLWQGSPNWKLLAVRAYHVRKVAIYFSALALGRLGFGIMSADASKEMWVSCALLLVLGSIAVGLLAMLAYLSGRATVYSVTSRRLLIRHGVAVPMTMNVPFRQIDGADVKLFPDGTGDIVVTLPKSERIGFLVTWPHLRPGHIGRPQPSFRALSRVEEAAAILSRALADDQGGSSAGVLAASQVSSTSIEHAAPLMARAQTAAA